MAKYEKRSPEDIKKEMDLYNQKIIDLGESFKRDPAVIAEYLEFSSKFYRYSPRNQQLIFSQNERASFVGSYQFYKEKGYQVQKGQKSMKILVPVKASYFYRDGENTSTPLINATKSERERIKRGEIEVKSVMRFKLGSVFDISQTDCPVAEYPRLVSFGEVSQDHATLYEQLRSYCEDQGFPVEETALRSIKLRGSYTPSTNEIRLNEKLQDTQKLGTFLHEMSHAFLDHTAEAYRSEISEHQHEFEADGLTIMFLSRFGLEVTEGTKDHLASHYQSFLEQIEALPAEEQKKYSLNLSMDKINNTYKEHIGAMEEHLNQLNAGAQSEDYEEEWEQEM